MNNKEKKCHCYINPIPVSADNNPSIQGTLPRACDRCIECQPTKDIQECKCQCHMETSEDMVDAPFDKLRREHCADKRNMIPEQEEWSIELEEFGALHDDDCDVMREDGAFEGCDCQTMKEVKAFISKTIEKEKAKTAQSMIDDLEKIRLLGHGGEIGRALLNKVMNKIKDLYLSKEEE